MEDSVVASGVEERCLSLPSFPFAYGSASPEFVSHLIPRSMYICYSDAEDIHLFYYIFVFFSFLLHALSLLFPIQTPLPCTLFQYAMR